MEAKELDLMYSLKLELSVMKGNTGPPAATCIWKEKSQQVRSTLYPFQTVLSKKSPAACRRQNTLSIQWIVK